MRLLFYDDRSLATGLADGEAPIFLAGPTSQACRTHWRIEALELLESRGFTGAVILPEFRDRAFSEVAANHFAGEICPVPGMHPVSYNILKWETYGIEHASCVLFWMPFVLTREGDLDSLPGFTTRAEVSRELTRDPDRIVLGMPADALSSAHIRYHAYFRGVPIHETLTKTVDAALSILT